MQVQQTSLALITKASLALVNGSGSVTSAVVYYAAEADEPIYLAVTAGALTGTTPTFTVEVQTMTPDQSSATGQWMRAFISGAIPTNGRLTTPLQMCAGKMRLVITKFNADNAGAPDIQILSRTKPVADPTP